MVPGRNLCMAGWNKEYSGRLMSSQDNEYGATEYICVDSNPDRGHSSRSQHFRLFDVEARCGTLKCPPYVDGQEITCVVCSSQT
ncbi:hypothetical protein FSP39_016845 [Pinctada imbricata]|uniref:Uncharacterized protein n=1 Tax=Pinctada imbricata TaxID=66713 RepID=A0AA89BM70_PINIB|nr:hypothetical protein FSP39_016845 [Pinctada imbricata]